MAIKFKKSQFGVTPYTREETEMKREERAARGATPQVLLREDFIHRKHDEFEELRGSYIEINREACTDEEYADLSAGNGLDRNTYGSKWRIWTGGFPTQEQMTATPWEEAGGSSVET